MRILLEEACGDISRCYTDPWGERIAETSVSVDLRYLQCSESLIEASAYGYDLHCGPALSTPFCPKDTDFKRAFGHTCTCLAKDSFTSLDTKL
jgi:hypothetical protein